MSKTAKVVLNTIKDFQEIGLVDKITMREFENLCTNPEYSGDDIKKIREQNKVSQSVFANYLNASVKSIQQWEQNLRKPNGQALKLIHLIEKNGLQYINL